MERIYAPLRHKQENKPADFKLVKKPEGNIESLKTAERIVWEEFVEKRYRKQRLNLDYFIGKHKDYTQTIIQKDKKFIKEKEARISQEKTKYAEELEALLYHFIETENWFGKNCSSFQTTLFDDFNGADLVLEFRNEDGSFERLIIDVTTSATTRKGDRYSQNKNEKERGLEVKLDHVKKDIQTGKLAGVKYFKSEESGLIGPVEQAPRAIIGFSSSSKKTEELIHQVARFVKKPGEKANARIEIEKLGIQNQLILEIRNQIKNQIIYACQIFLEKVRPEILRKYKPYFDAGKKVYNSKKIKELESLKDISQSLLDSVSQKGIQINILVGSIIRNKEILQRFKDIYDLHGIVKKHYDLLKNFKNTSQKKIRSELGSIAPDDTTVEVLTQIWSENQNIKDPPYLAKA